MAHNGSGLFATWFNHKLPRFVSPIPDQLTWQIDALSLQWKELDAYTFPPVVILVKLLDLGCRRMILISPGWPNMPWFWDLVSMSVQIPLSLNPSLPNLNLHAWLLEPQSFCKKASLTKWQQELKLLRDGQPEPSVSRNGPFLSDGVRRVRWTSGLFL